MSFNERLDLRAVVVNLVATNEGRVPLTQGALAHAAFLDLVRAADVGLAERLHDSGSRQPFTLSPLRDLPARLDAEGYRLLAGARVALRLTLLDPNLFVAFLQRVLAAGPNLRLRIGDVMFAVESATGAPGSHPWAGYATSGELLDRAAAADRIRMVFASPTAMNWGAGSGGGAVGVERRMILLPWPQAVFAALRGAWNRHTGDDIPIEFERWVEVCVVVREVRHWETAVYRLKNGAPHPGGWGDVSFEALDHRPDYLRILNLLADFAFYSGVGSKTTMGMGQARRVSWNYPTICP